MPDYKILFAATIRHVIEHFKNDIAMRKLPTEQRLFQYLRANRNTMFFKDPDLLSLLINHTMQQRIRQNAKLKERKKRKKLEAKDLQV